MRTLTTVLMMCGAVASAAGGGPSFRLIGSGVDGGVVPSVASSEAGVVAGRFESPAGRTVGRWSASGGVTLTPWPLLAPDDFTAIIGVGAISPDGRSVGVHRGSLPGAGVPAWWEAAVWRADGSLTGIEPLTATPGARVIVRAMSPDGAFVAGDAESDRGREAFLWSAGTGSLGLGDLQTALGAVVSSEALWVSDDGSRVRGVATAEGGWAVFEWTRDAGMAAISPVFTGPFVPVALEASADGTALVGFATGLAPGATSTAFVWTEALGFEILPNLSQPAYDVPAGVSDGGGVVAASLYIWTREDGPMRTGDLFNGFGPALWYAHYWPAWVSADGNIVTGVTSFFTGGGWEQFGFVYHFDDPCPADLNRDGAADFFDVAAFIRAYTAGDLFADENLDGRLDFFDVQQFLNALAGGCP